MMLQQLQQTSDAVMQSNAFCCLPCKMRCSRCNAGTNASQAQSQYLPFITNAAVRHIPRTIQQVWRPEQDGSEPVSTLHYKIRSS
jgi:hypothetical protein